MSKEPLLVDQTGLPIPRSKPVALNGNSNVPYDAADWSSQHMAAWNPPLWSPDGELNPYRDRIVSRVRDLVRNDGWASGVVTRVLDNAIGGQFRPIAKPDYRALKEHSGCAFDAVWAAEWARAVDAHWRSWADDPGFWCDAGRHLTFTQMMWVGMRHELVDGDAVALPLWRPERLGRGRARYATTIQLIDPDRLSNPQLVFDQQTMRGGVEVDADGSAVAYHIRKAHQGDWWSAADSVTWERIPRETRYGRPLVVHHFQADRAGQHRGGAGILTPVLQRLKMLIKYDGVELDAAIINAIFSAYVESPMDPQLVQEALGGNEEVNTYQSLRSAHHDQKRIMLGDARIPQLFPGEAIKTVAPARPNGNFREFQGAVLRNVASGAGVSAQQVSNDWSDVNYSSARAALLEAWKTLDRRRTNLAIGFASPLRAAWLEEAMDLEELPMPRGAVPEFIDCRAAYARCRWLGPGRGWIDPVAEKQGSVLGMDAGLSTLEDEVAEYAGGDWEERVDQRAIEVQRFRDRGLPVPTWAGLNPMQNQGGTAEKASTPPKKPDAT